MDDILIWAFGMSWAGILWSLVTWGVAEGRGNGEEVRRYASGLIACLVLAGAVIVTMIFAGLTDDRQDTAAVTGMIIGGVAGVFTAFGVMGGKPPATPPA